MGFSHGWLNKKGAYNVAGVKKKLAPINLLFLNQYLLLASESQDEDSPHQISHVKC